MFVKVLRSCVIKDGKMVFRISINLNKNDF